MMLAGVSAAAAHPHVWVVARTELVFDDANRLAAIRDTWTFDEAYSAFMTMNLAPNHEGKPDQDKLNELAKTNLDSVAEFGFFTHGRANGKPLVFAEPEAPAQTFSNGRLNLTFTLPLRTPIAPPKVMVMTIDDPSFFVAFSLAAGNEAARLTMPPTGCVLNVNRAAQVAEEGKQLVPDEVAATAAPAVGADYTNRIVLVCP
jgi:ABC-type uncharacterized transport system substrate-binding protein